MATCCLLCSVAVSSAAAVHGFFVLVSPYLPILKLGLLYGIREKGHVYIDFDKPDFDCGW